MRLEGDHKFNALRQQVWDMLMDPEVIAKAMSSLFGNLTDLVGR